MPNQRQAELYGTYKYMRPYPPELDNSIDLANRATIAAEEINLAAGTAEAEKHQLAAQFAIGAKAIKDSSEQIDKDLAAHTNASLSADEARALHAEAGFGPNNKAAGQVESHLGAAVEALSEERSALAGLQHTLALGDGAGFDERKAQVNGLDLRALIGMCATLLQTHHTLQRRIEGLIIARKDEFAAIKGIQHTMEKAIGATQRAEAAANENPENSPAAIAYRLREIEAALADAPQALARVGAALGRVTTLISEADDLANLWHSGGTIPGNVVQVQTALNAAVEQLTLPPHDLFDGARMQVGLSARSMEQAVSVKQTATDGKNAAAKSMNAINDKTTEYIETRGG